MTGKTHLAFGVLLGMNYAIYADGDLSTRAAIIGTTALFSVVPDICHSKSKLGRKIWPFSLLIRMIFGHRTVTHSLLFMAICAMILYALQVDTIYILSCIIGISSHILLDMMTPQGVTLFFPIKKKIAFPMTVKTGGIIDLSLATTFSVLTTYIFYKALWSQLINWLN